MSITLQPLQFRFVQLLEGYWPLQWFGWAFRVGVRRQLWRRNRAVRTLSIVEEAGRSPARSRVLWEWSQAAEATLRSRFPAEDRLLPTTLGNVLRAAEDRHGRRYGMDGVLVWPRLFPLLPPAYAQSIEDEVTQLDVSSRLVLTWGAAATAGTGILLWHHGDTLAHPWWLAYAATLWALALLSYRAAVESAVAHGQDIEIALDLYRNLVLDASRLPLPRRLSQERVLFADLCELYGTSNPASPLDLRYRPEDGPHRRSAQTPPA